MTQRLYYDDSYLTDFEATVLERGEGGRLYLDRSAFYPTSGGQQFDRGSLRSTAAAGADSGLVNVSVHFGVEASTLDLDASSLTPEQVALAEERANAVVFENRPLSVETE